MSLFQSVFGPGGLLGWLLGVRFMLGVIDPGTAILIAGGLGVGGSLLAGAGTASAQRQANRTNAAIAAQQSRDAYNNWLVSRGINPGMAGLPDTQRIVAQRPELQAEWNRVRALGDKRPFETWLQDYLRENPQSEIAQQFSSGAVNTSLPLWAQTGGMPTEQFLLNTILERSGLARPAFGDAGHYGSPEVINAFLAANPNARTEVAAMLAESGDGRSVEKWMADNLAAGDPNFNEQLRRFSLGQAADYDAQQAARTAIDPRLLALQDRAIATVGSIFDGGLLREELSALDPVLAARAAAAELQKARNAELRSRIDDVYGAELLSADAYGAGALEAVNRVLAQNQAKRRLQGYSGGSSFDDLSRTRTLAPALTQGALVRAGAEVNRATRRGQVLDADADIARQNAELQNALDRLQLVSGDIRRRTGSLGAPAALSAQGLQLKTDAYSSAFSDLDAVMGRLGLFRSNNSTPPTPQQAPVQPVMSGAQIAGSALSQLGQMGMDYWTTQSLINAMKPVPAGVGNFGSTSFTLAPAGTSRPISGGGFGP